MMINHNLINTTNSTMFLYNNRYIYKVIIYPKLFPIKYCHAISCIVKHGGLKPHYMIHHYTHHHEDGGRVMNNKKVNLIYKL
ncbi:hypothetical protein HanIR_Chr11g0527191 [Helianthus annuus]|nr:hypothetical protein HanIR_Chr11g0527191 [Helianthus annuus]